jgi:hypothetical protein
MESTDRVGLWLALTWCLAFWLVFGVAVVELT